MHVEARIHDASCAECSIGGNGSDRIAQAGLEACMIGLMRTATPTISFRAIRDGQCESSSCLPAFLEEIGTGTDGLFELARSM